MKEILYRLSAGIKQTVLAGAWGLLTAVYAQAGADIKRVSLDESNRQFIGSQSRQASISADDGLQAQLPPGVAPTSLVFDASLPPAGRYVIFSSKAANLVVGDSNEQTDVFVRDLVLDKTERVSIAANGGEGNAASAYASISFGGRFVVFRSQADNLVGGDTNAVSDVFVRDRLLGKTKRVSTAADGTQGDAGSGIVTRLEDGIVSVFNRPVIDWIGFSVTFDSEATNLIDNDVNGERDIFVRSRFSLP
ncbi:hypothetical protein FKG94_03750 [Exilibacterium tricleocarpae]|uniref:Uncharacterized protein n=1 Tax=Exilibacterium tricleocarpae TaxID=2591008 RepID=A0A545U5A2_9GAMM|nr:hypothetical protein [Exilibacterium tricleocarpae]TQV84646.1 hypothetical protein FKG94_03750 [Exilibacterium tricleocarpae]